jgi:hypothetical protein
MESLVLPATFTGQALYCVQKIFETNDLHIVSFATTKLAIVSTDIFCYFRTRLWLLLLDKIIQFKLYNL